MKPHMRWMLCAALLTAALAGTGSSQAADPGCASLSVAGPAAGCAGAVQVALDLELTRLFDLALADQRALSDGGRALRDWHEAWIDQSDGCVDRSDPAECAVRSQVAFIAGLRRQYPAARSADADGVSLGPVGFVCSDTAGPVDAVFVTAEGAGFVSLMWDGTDVILPQAVSASGARFEENAGPDKPVEFWIKGNAAMFRPGNGSVHECEAAAAD